MAQCVWDEGMAESIASNLGNKTIVVLAGNGHIQYKYGIPDRAFRRTGASFRTIYLAPVGEEVELGIADYIWVTPNKEVSGFGFRVRCQDSLRNPDCFEFLTCPFPGSGYGPELLLQVGSSEFGIRIPVQFAC